MSSPPPLARLPLQLRWTSTPPQRISHIAWESGGPLLWAPFFSTEHRLSPTYQYRVFVHGSAIKPTCIAPPGGGGSATPPPPPPPPWLTSAATPASPATLDGAPVISTRRGRLGEVAGLTRGPELHCRREDPRLRARVALHKRLVPGHSAPLDGPLSSATVCLTLRGLSCKELRLKVLVLVRLSSLALCVACPAVLPYPCPMVLFIAHP